MKSIHAVQIAAKEVTRPNGDDLLLLLFPQKRSIGDKTLKSTQ
jgi:hypothetical protein